MRYCNNCHIHYDTPLEQCMFCNEDLEVKGDTTYKFAPYRKKGLFRVFYRLFIFLNIISLTLSLYLDFEANGQVLIWSPLVALTNLLAIVWVMLLVAPGMWISKVNKMVVTGLLWITGIAYFIGIQRLIIDYVIPFSFVFNIALLTLLLVIDRKKWFDYASGLFFFSVVGILPGIFNILGITEIRWPSLVSMLYGIVTLLGLFFFSSKETKDEFKRRFHI